VAGGGDPLFWQEPDSATMKMRKLLGALKVRLTNASPLSQRQAIGGLVISTGLLIGGVSVLMNPLVYPAGDVRGYPWFNTLVGFVFSVAGIAGLARALTALAGRRREGR
jgi:hypothetical protein